MMDQTTREALLMEARERGNGSTHWEGCEKQHPWCAVLKLGEELERMRGQRDRMEALALHDSERADRRMFLLSGFHRSARGWHERALVAESAASFVDGRRKRSNAATWDMAVDLSEARQRADAAERRADDAEERVRQLEATLAEHEVDAQMACENPCGDCAGCNYAHDVYMRGDDVAQQPDPSRGDRGNAMTDQDRDRGLYGKYYVSRVHDPEGKHEDCEYYVLDLDHDPHAKPALLAYADSAEADGYEQLAQDLRDKARAMPDPSRGDREGEVFSCSRCEALLNEPCAETCPTLDDAPAREGGEHGR